MRTRILPPTLTAQAHCGFGLVLGGVVPMPFDEDGAGVPKPVLLLPPNEDEEPKPVADPDPNPAAVAEPAPPIIAPCAFNCSILGS